MRLSVSECISVKGRKGSSGPCHVGNERWASGPCSNGARSASLQSDVRRTGCRMERRSQGGRGKWWIHRVFGVCEMEKLGLKGLKMEGMATFHFCTTPLGFCIACEMALEVWNYFADPLGFCTVCEMVLGIQSFSHALRNFSRVRNEFVWYFYFCWVCEISHPMQNEPWISHALWKFRRVYELPWCFLCQEFLRTHPTALKSPLELIIKNLS